MLKKWELLPESFKTSAVRPYYDLLQKKRVSLFLKRFFDIVVSGIGLILLSPVFLILAVLITADSKGGIFFRQERVTQYGKVFRIHKFRTMVANAEAMGSMVTVKDDKRITKVGAKLRHLRLDELPQLIDIFVGDMTFVGTRPESTKYVAKYTPEMMATLLLPAGVTSEASIKYKDEEKLLGNVADVDGVYINEILPEKMKYNLESIKKFSFFREIGLMFRTVAAVLKNDDGTEKQ